MKIDRSPQFDMNVDTMERFCKRCITNLLQWVWHDKPSDKLIQSSIWLFRSFVIGSSFDRSNRIREGCHHYIWKSQGR